MKFTTLAFIFFVLSLVAPIYGGIVKVSWGEKKVACTVTELQPCLPSVIDGSQPSTQCCEKLKEQNSCFCDYLQNPQFSQYITAAKQILAACKIPYPNC
ncbi:putative bifunctional inhibitor/plant lipid transfer protein/seed storage helical [Arabidopsis thaliana]|uniref:At1g43668 n=3 Tax=Arabidopsis TaxID=3701 RepID=Q8GX11_ARATH|nr:Bifunctional inhibitor/lipid-transfer protein/seed storage 2S albumin superfamily protein [Arabidopsis thaliana]KAG7648689.1 Bifunctional inhibitor/plant lipid transfer protein/seed storage helical domain superfamily [Arabidopsis thaliana x Arabidopsis arenosa]KAG7656580.1 Bifunctional inhibitor/plant lipid transfer protein/seed storage helical domain superfamily [Arabidopsis suecica]AAO42935.1 At1g43668 [Arabidopsis thaliana]AEE31984.1 Bifunctional inhibitor/lipid-transfer protein/seed stor|eukprot:NP_849769.1 Bifunctional inhibitor/lipid-transfer protein/seed storage 2S albumin superfamily protein [Arabidopsis thaliana]